MKTQIYAAPAVKGLILWKITVLFCSNYSEFMKLCILWLFAQISKWTPLLHHCTLFFYLLHPIVCWWGYVTVLCLYLHTLWSVSPYTDKLWSSLYSLTALIILRRTTVDNQFLLYGALFFSVGKLGNAPLSYFIVYPSKHKTTTQCRFDAGPASKNLDQH